MPRKAFSQFEAVSAVIPHEGGYRAAIAIKRHDGGAPTFHTVLPSQTFKTAHEADVAASHELERLIDVTEVGELVF